MKIFEIFVFGGGSLLALRRQATKIAHQRRNVVVGIKAEVTAAIADGRRPTGMTDNEETVHDFSMELHQNKNVIRPQL